MKFMFAFTKLEEINGISNWDVSNVKNFSAMFQGHNHIGDIKLKSLSIESWNTSSAESMSHMFYGCS
jgi:surface protein